MSFAEVPLFYPSLGSTRRRFVVNDEAKTIERTSSRTTPCDNAALHSDVSLQLSGSASASSLENAVVTTCALAEEPKGICVSLVQGTASPIMVELDFTQAQIFGIPIKIQCFDDENAITMRLVDTRGFVLSITFDSSSLTPSSLELVNIPRLVEAQVGYSSGATLESSMVTFVSPTVLVVGLAPNLFAVNVVSEDIDIWSQAQTLEEMKSRGLGLMSVFMGGRSDHGDEMVDMPPAAAICQAGGQFVFSLHSDASIRRWRLDNLHPVEMAELRLGDTALPHPNMWSDAKGAVALCAQLYPSVYALAIHVQTVGEADDDETKSPCHMVVVYGSQDEEEGGDLVKPVLQLDVPKGATSLVGIDLASERCRLTALFQSRKEDTNNTLLVTYPPSVVSIVSSEPIVTPQANTLDGVAASERARLAGLDFTTRGTTLDEDLHSVDAAFLKYLFLPAFPSGSGVVTPTSCVRAAIAKLVPGHYSGETMSIELETLRAMHEWRRLDNRNAATSSPVRPSVQGAITTTPRGTTVYDTYAGQNPERTPEMNIDDSFMEDDEQDENLADQERAAQVESHKERWRELLLAVWQEEERLRDPLCLSNFLSTDTSSIVVVRAGVTSIFKEVATAENATSSWEDLDRTALILLDRIERNEECAATLRSNETLLFEEIAKASLVLSTGTVDNQAEILSGVAIKAIKELVDDEIKREGVAFTLCGASQEDTLVWLQSVDSLSSLGLPGASVLPDSADVLDDDTDKTWSNRIVDTQTRLAASSLFVQCTDSVRRLALARFLLLSTLDGDAFSLGGYFFQSAFRQYLYSVSVLWTCAQHVPMSSAGLTGANRSVQFGSSPAGSPPTKRVNFGETTSSILADGTHNKNVTTALDARLIQISQEHCQTLYEIRSPDGPIVTMARICLNSTFAAALSNTLPELGILTTPSDASVASDYPRLALRLIAPFYASPPLNEDEDLLLARKEALAECLLIEANAESQKGAITDLVNASQQKACDLLAPSSDDMPSVEHNLLETVFMKLTKLCETMAEPRLEEVEAIEKALADELQLLLIGTQGRPGTEIKRLCGQPTVKAVFLPLMATEHKSFFRSLEDLSRASVKSMVEILLRISKLTHRLSILERHSGNVGALGRNTLSEKNDFLLGYIEGAIAEFQTLLPSSVYSSMAEYATLWSLLFNHSVSSRRWRTAETVCVNHPVPERRVDNYKRLVIAMANAGALSDLIDLCDSLVTEGDETLDSLGGGTEACIDFYEIAAEALATSKQGDPYENGSISTDFLGCLYALHASQGHWKRAAQAMDAKYSAALKALSYSMVRGTSLTSIVNVNAAVNDLVLASLLSSNAVQSISKDPAKRFLVSGEVGPFPGLPIAVATETDMETDATEGFGTTNKRARSGLGLITPRKADSVQRDADETRLSRFMTVTDLNARAARAIALWTLLQDEKCDPSEVSLSTIQVPSAEGDLGLINRLSALGYYDHAILLAKAIRGQYEYCPDHAEPGARGLLQDAILCVLTYVFPVALNVGGHPSNDDMETDIALPRPTFSQLRRNIEKAGGMSTSSFSFVLGETWCPIPELPKMATAAAAKEFIRKLTIEFSSSSSPIALEVATMYLDIDLSGASLPLWLERLLLGIRDESTGDSSGLFAHKATADGGFSGDPAGLLGLYTKRGLYPKACDIVSMVLAGTLQTESGAPTRETRAPARLPEKGDIDFVPYAKIDVLWNLIDRAVSDPTMSAAERALLEESRKTMEESLEKHFRLMKISEQGMQSARALTQ